MSSHGVARVHPRPAVVTAAATPIPVPPQETMVATRTPAPATMATAGAPIMEAPPAEPATTSRSCSYGFFPWAALQRIEEHSGGSFVGLGGFGQCGLKFCLGHLKRIWKVVYRMRT